MSKALICRGFLLSEAGYQQSYPQNALTNSRLNIDQRLSPTFHTPLQIKALILVFRSPDENRHFSAIEGGHNSCIDVMQARNADPCMLPRTYAHLCLLQECDKPGAYRSRYEIDNGAKLLICNI